MSLAMLEMDKTHVQRSELVSTECRLSHLVDLPDLFLSLLPDENQIRDARALGIGEGWLVWGTQISPRTTGG